VPRQILQNLRDAQEPGSAQSRQEQQIFWDRRAMKI
jgi:hypothetical protein